MNESTPITDLWPAYEASKLAEQKAWDRLIRTEAQHGEAATGFRHPKVVIADAVHVEASARKAAVRRAIVARQVTSEQGMEVLRKLAGDLASGRYLPADVRSALKAARAAGWRSAA